MQQILVECVLSISREVLPHRLQVFVPLDSWLPTGRVLESRPRGLPLRHQKEEGGQTLNMTCITSSVPVLGGG